MISLVLDIFGLTLYILLVTLYWIFRGRKLRSLNRASKKNPNETKEPKPFTPTKPVIAPSPEPRPTTNVLRSSSSSSYPIYFKMANCQAICLQPFEYSYKGKGDDRIYCGKILEKSPIVIVADGASGRIDKTNNEVIEGGGGEAAEIVKEEVLKHLNNVLRSPRPNVQTILKHLRQAYEVSVTKLKEHDIPSKTTLLIAFLHEIGTEAYWFYAFEGDGAIVLMNPKRKMDGKLLRTELLMPGQKMFTTATVSHEGLTIPPVVACMAYEVGDIIYLASDGMDAVDNALYRDKKTFLANYIHDNLREKLDANFLNEKLLGFQFSDDAVLGLIWTSERPQ